MAGRDRSSADRLVQARHGGAAVWPALEVDTGSVLMLHAGASAGDGFGVTSRSYVGERARTIFDWMTRRSAEWPLWDRAAVLFGEAAVRSLVVVPAEREAEADAFEAEHIRLQAEDDERLRKEIDLFILDPKGRRPGISLESANEQRPFLVMRFSEKWERERVLDWLRWQKARYFEFRELFDAQGQVAVERAIIAGMRETEADVKARGLSSGGRRPLRFWRGE